MTMYELGLTLLYSLWQGAAIVVLFAVANRLLRTASAEARYATGCAALFGMLAAPLATFIWLIENSPVAAAEGLGRNTPVQSIAWVPFAGSATDGAWDRIQFVLPWIAGLWLCGVAALAIRNLTAWRLLQYRRNMSAPAPPEWREMLARIARRLHVSRPVEVSRSNWVTAPAVLGWLRPVVLVPIGAVAGLSAEQLEAILAHELAHIRRNDYLVNLLQTAVETLLFYHPAVWVSRQVRQERENCCDDLAIEACGNRAVYARALLELEQHRSASPELALAAGGGSLQARIRRILYRHEADQASPWTASAGILVLSAVFFSWTGQLLLAQIPEAYRKWLNEDVVYIITAQERAAFERLASDRDCERFIEEFWLRRDPTPGTARNEFKEEHYRRIAYANERFHTVNVPGWKTDRGRIYIIFGPPDGIESHPEQFEIWFYRSVPGTGKTVKMRFDSDGKDYVLRR